MNRYFIYFIIEDTTKQLDISSNHVTMIKDRQTLKVKSQNILALT